MNGTWDYPPTVVQILVPNDGTCSVGDKVTRTDERNGLTHEWTVVGFWEDAGYAKLERRRNREYGR